MANKDLEKGKQLLKDQVEEVGVLDNAFKSLSAVITTALEEAADSLSGIDKISEKIAKSYKRDIEASLKAQSKSLEKDVIFQMKINKGINVQKEIQEEIEKVTSRQLILDKKIEDASGELKAELEKEKSAINEVTTLRLKELNTLKEKNKIEQRNKSLSSILLENAVSYADKIDKTGTLSGILSGNFKEVVTATRIAEISAVAMGNALLKAFTELDKSTGDLAKNLNVSYSEANALQKELFIGAVNSNSVFVTTKGMSESLGFINQQLGTSVMLNKENLALFTQLRKSAGLTNEELAGINSLSLANGESLEDNANTILNQVSSLNRQTGIYLNEKEILKGIKDVSASTTLSLGKNPGLIAEAVATSKALGMELSKVDAIAGSLLDFESSISSELEAELLLGRNINLEKARQAALNNDLATVAKEISEQAGSSAEFGAMNRIQQEAIAKAMGMGRDDLAKSLFVQEQLVGASEGESKRRQEILDKRIEEVGLAQAQRELENGGLENLMTASLIKAVAVISAAGAINPLAAIAGLGLLAAGVATAKAVTVDDVIIPPGYGDTIVKRGKDTIALNNNDTLVAGTNLGGGDNRTGEKTNQLLEALIMQNAKKPELSPVGLYEIQ